MEKRNYIACLKFVKKYVCRIAGYLGALIIFISITNVLNYLYVNDEDVAFVRVLWHNFYEDKGKIDNVYLGSSHVYSDINPMLLNDINGQYNFDLASSLQRLNGSYYLLKETDRNNSLSHVYLDLYYTVSVKNNQSPDLDPINVSQQWNWNNSDFMESSFNKLAYMLSIAGPEKYSDIFLPFSRYRSNLDNWDYINKRLEGKKSDAYLSYENRTDFPDGTYGEYRKQGYYYSNEVIKNKKIMLAKSDGLYDEPMGDKSKEYLCKIIKYCQKRDIPITLFVTPINDFQLINLGNYDNYINEVKAVSDKFGIDFYDFNLAKSEYFFINRDEYFRDFTHLNAMGAEVFTNFFAKVVSGTSEENQKYFYSSYSEKLQNEPGMIYGLYYMDSIAAGGGVRDAEDITKSIRTLWVASNKEEGMEYRIIMTPEESEKYTVQDFSENKEFAIPIDEHGVCTIVARMADNPEDVQMIEFEY